MHQKQVVLILLLLVNILMLPLIAGATEENIGGVKGLSERVSNLENTMDT